MLLQRVVETLLFYHPAVWWLSRRLRAERELCCDELAVAVTGRRLEYVQALETVARGGGLASSPLLAAGIRGERNMRLLERVRNVLGLSADGRTLAAVAGGLVGPALPLVACGPGRPGSIAAAIGRRGRRRPTTTMMTTTTTMTMTMTATKAARERDDDDDDDDGDDEKDGKDDDDDDDDDREEGKGATGRRR